MDKFVVEILDTTLRDGAQAEGVSFSVNDKFQILDSLVSLGIRYIEAGNPGSNPKDREFFSRFLEQRTDMGQSVLAAFGSTKRKGTAVEEDPGLLDLLSANTPDNRYFWQGLGCGSQGYPALFPKREPGHDSRDGRVPEGSGPGSHF